MTTDKEAKIKRAEEYIDEALLYCDLAKVAYRIQENPISECFSSAAKALIYATKILSEIIAD